MKIGVFDSGLGGLTVAHAIMQQLPAESILYFGDTARVPYGPKSPETVRRYSREIAAFLLGEGVNAVVVACNTATAHALPVLEAELPVPVIGVVKPGARAAVRLQFRPGGREIGREAAVGGPVFRGEFNETRLGTLVVIGAPQPVPRAGDRPGHQRPGREAVLEELMVIYRFGQRRSGGYCIEIL